ncbi:MAG: hypothetical protein IOC87_02830 [Rhodobacter sp.]|nr:hypothetical protein [Rhodobacter sp.]
MTVAELIEMCERRILHLNAVRGSAANLGDMQQVSSVDAQITATQNTLNQLRTLTD